MIALSTAWSPRRRASLARTFAAGRKLGFTAFELGISPAPFDLRAVGRALERGDVTITSVHAVCSERDLPPANRRGDWVADPDETIRREGVARVKETLDNARRVGAAAVVLHGGVLPLPEARDLQLEAFRAVSRGEPPPPFARLVPERQVLAPAYLAALADSLTELCDYAPDLTLALENRFYVTDLPMGDEFHEIFGRVPAPNLRYWHDVGHAQVLDRIGCIDQVALLEAQADRLAGMHLHDIAGFDDHRPPGTGDFNFGALTEFLRPDVIRVMEIAPGHSPKAVRRGREHLAEVYGIA